MSETIDKQISENELVVSKNGLNFLKYSAKWANFLAILGFIGLGLMVLGGLVSIIAGASISRIPGMQQFAVIGIVYLVLAVLYFFPTLYLYQFASKTKKAIQNRSQENLDLGLENLKSFFKFLGIFTIVVISMYILILFIAIIAAAFIR